MKKPQRFHIFAALLKKIQSDYSHCGASIIQSVQ